MTDLDEQAELGQLAFNAYSDTTGWLNHQGKAIPPWEELGPQVQAAWIAAANAIVEYLMGPESGD